MPGVQGRRLLSLVNEDKLRRILARMLDEERFLGPHGIRSVSRWHLEHPYAVNVAGGEYSVQYEPAESTMASPNRGYPGPAACSPASASRASSAIGGGTSSMASTFSRARAYATS